MSLEDVKAQLEHQNREQERTTDSVEALRTMFMERFKMEDRGKLDELEALKESKGKGSKGAPQRRDKAKAESGRGLNLAFDPLALLSGAALPALVALGASLTGFDAAIKALKIPDYISSISRALTSVSDMFTKMNTKATDLVDKIKIIRLPKLPEIDIPKLKVTMPDSWSTLGTKITTAIGDALPKVEDIKIPKIKFPDFPDITAKFPKMPEFELPRIPEIKVPEKITTFFDSIRSFNQSLVDFVAPKVPKVDLINKDGTKFKFPEFKIPEGLKNIKFPDMSGVKTFFVGTEAGGGVVGFLTKAAEMVGKIPGVSMVARIVGGPVTQAIISIIDFFVGFYKGFTETELDADGNEIVRSFGDKLMDGLEGGVDGVFKGITDGVQLLFLDIPKWILKKLGFDMSWMDGFDLWDDFVSPVWEVIKAIPKFIFSAEYRKEQMDKVKAKWEEAGGIVGIAMSIYDTIVEVVNNALESLPSPSELAEKLVSSLPKWMRPDTVEEQRADLQADLAQAIKDRDAATPQAERGMFSVGKSREAFQLDVDRIKRQLEELPEAARGGYTNPLSSALGSLIKIHPNELVLPLDSTPEGKALSKLSKVLNVTSSEMQNAQREYSSMSGTSMPTVINNIVDNSTKQSSSIQNRSSFTAPPVTVDASLPVGLV